MKKSCSYSPEETKQYRTDQLKHLEEELEHGVVTFFTSERFMEFLTIMSKFHNYSFNNCMLIAVQRPDATYVAGYRSWIRDFHRVVKKGEKGIRILHPVTHKKKDAQTGDEIITTSFRPAYVFDISQTNPIEGMEPVDLDLVHKLQGTVKNYDDLLRAIIHTAPVPVSFADIPEGVNGYFSPKENRIVIQNGMSQLQTIKTLLHELAHSVLHNKEALRDLPEQPDQADEEIQAESTAFMVSALLGLDTRDYSFPYIATWCANKSAAKLSASMGLVRAAADILYDSIMEKFDRT